MNRRFSMARAWKLVVSLLVLLIVAAFLVPIPVNLELAGVEVNMQEETHLIPRTITIEGALHLDLIRGHRFSGEIWISGYAPPEGAPMEELVFSHGSKETAIVYRFPPDEQGNRRSCAYGYLYAEPFFRNVMIAVCDHEGDRMEGGSFSTMDGTCVVTGVQTREEAMDRIERYLW